MEKINQATRCIDEVSTLEMVQLCNREDKTVALAVEPCLPAVAKAVDMIVTVLRQGGRLFYIGSGTGGKIGMLDATECPPTFGTDDNTVVAVLSGGREAAVGWREETEDDESLAVCDLKARRFGRNDILVAISASGNTPYALAGIRYALCQGSRTIGLSCSPGSKLETLAEHCITVDVGPEVIMGSTRLKAGTAQKMVLNMLSTCSMIQLGKTYENLMVDVRPINSKLRRRVLQIIQTAAGVDETAAQQALLAAQGNAKVAILSLLRSLPPQAAAELLAKHQGFLKKAVKDGVE